MAQYVENRPVNDAVELLTSNGVYGLAEAVMVTIGGEPLSYRLYHFRLVFSEFCCVGVVLAHDALGPGVQLSIRVDFVAGFLP